MGLLRVNLFGSPHIERDGEPIRFDTRKAAALLAYLAVTGRPHRRDALASMLWPASDQVKARSALRRTLSVAGGVGTALAAGREEVGLTPDLLTCDVTEFEQLVATADLASRRQAVDLATGEFMTGFTLRDSPAFDDWLVATADHLRDQLVASLSLLVVDDARAGRLDAALSSTRRWLAADPMSEVAHCELMRLLTWTGQRPMALRQYRTLVRILDQELGVAPLPETNALYDAIRNDRLPLPEAHQDDDHARLVVGRRPVVSTQAPHRQLVGRDDERKRLLAAWQASARARGLVGLVGEPGLGRSALAQDLATEVDRLGGRSLVVRAHEGERGLALAAARDVVRGLTQGVTTTSPLSAELSHELVRLDPSLGDVGLSAGPLESPGAQVRFFDAVRQLLEESLVGDPPGLLVIDDAQWLDPSSDDLLVYAIRRLPPNVLVLVTWRAGAGSCALTRLVVDGGQVMALSGLTREGVTELIGVEGATDLDPLQVHQRTAGVPRLVLEHVAAAQAGSAVTGPMRDLVVARLESAAPTTRQVLGAAAVFGTLVDVDLLRATAGRAELETVEALEDAADRGLLVEVAGQGGYDFPHDLLRAVVLERTSLARQRLLHSRAADVLMRRHASDEIAWPAGAVARHLAATSRVDEAASWYWQAAGEARALYAHREELQELNAAEAAGFDAALVHEARGDALTRLGRYRDALLALEQAAAATDQSLSLAVIEHKLAKVHDRLGDWAVAEAHLESSADLLAESGPLALRARVGADLALVLHRQNQDDRALSAAKDALACAERSQDVLALALVENVLGVLASARGELGVATQHLEQSGAWASQDDDMGVAVAAANNLARVYELSSRDDDALAAAEKALVLGERQGDRHRVAALHTNLADLLHKRGREDEAEQHARAAAAAFADVDDAEVRPQVWTLVEW